jgi:2-keto-myo-inositol isomerase
MIRFAVNRTVAPRRSVGDFLALAKAVGAQAVEVRNDVEGQEFADGTSAGELALRIAEAGLEVASINALQRFNAWGPEREREAAALVGYARELGAPGVVLCPVIEVGHTWPESELDAGLRAALRGLAPILRDNGVIGYVEPLGMPGSTLNRQVKAVEAMAEVDGTGTFALCYDTFQHFRASDTSCFPEEVGLVHVSGITRTDLAPEALTEPDRGLVDARDVAGTLAQLRRLLAAGYDGFVSVEPFDPAVQSDPDLVEALRASIAHMAAAT